MRADLPRYLALVNARLAERGQPPLALAQLAPGINQLKALVDVLHVHGLAVIFDLVFNHAGSGNFDDASMYFFDRQRNGDPNHSLYFTDREWAGDKAFALWNRDVRQFLIDDTKLFLEEYHIDGIRYDEVSALRNLGGAPADVSCRDVTGTVRFIRSQAIQIAEYWNDDRAFVLYRPPAGLGFDAALADGRAVPGESRSHIRAARGGTPPRRAGRRRRTALVVRAQPLPRRQRAAHDRARHSHAVHGPGIPRRPKLERQHGGRSELAHPVGPPGRRARPAGFRPLHARPDRAAPLRGRTPWRARAGDPRSRRQSRARLPALDRRRRPHARGGGELNETTWYGYRLGFPGAGRWRELFNSDVYDHFPNPVVAGNGGGVEADGSPLHGLPAAAAITIPANALLVFGR
jgi:1,4-alpha-glucan branching enzyme